ncbi:MAG: BMC domain-containing protein [Clostridia bacterium]|nr:BMC domain-containing protein [Clostridia bacterium]
MDLQGLIQQEDDKKLRIVQELVPGKQVTLAHIIANPEPVLYRKMGLNPSVDYSNSSIGIMTMSPAETSIIAGDIAMKASGAEIGFVDRFSGTLIMTGTVSEVEAAVHAVVDYLRETLKFTTVQVTKT